MKFQEWKFFLKNRLKFCHHDYDNKLRKEVDAITKWSEYEGVEWSEQDEDRKKALFSSPSSLLFSSLLYSTLLYSTLLFSSLFFSSLCRSLYLPAFTSHHPIYPILLLYDLYRMYLILIVWFLSNTSLCYTTPLRPLLLLLSKWN